MKLISYSLILVTMSMLAACHTVADTATGMATGVREDVTSVTGSGNKQTATTTTRTKKTYHVNSNNNNSSSSSY